MPTLKDRLETKMREPGACSQAGIITWHIHDILAALEHGMTYQAILDVMKDDGVTLNVSQFRDTVTRAKRKLSKSVGTFGIVKSIANVPVKGEPVPKSTLPKPSAPTATSMASVPTPPGSPASKPAANPTMDQLIAMLPPCPINNQIEIDHSLPDSLPPGVNIELLKRVMKMDSFNPSGMTDPHAYLVSALPAELPSHINPLAEIGGLRCDFRLGMPVEFGSSQDGLGVKRGDEHWDKIISDEKLRKQWRSAHNKTRNLYDDWLRQQVGLPFG